jgi:RNA recognition motif-containing protein
MSCKLFVANFPYSTTNEELNTLFGPHGNVLSVKIATDRETGRSRGFGFVEMDSEQEADNAIRELDGYQLGGRSLAVRVAEERSRPGGPGGPGGGPRGPRGPRSDGGGFGGPRGGGGGGFGGPRGGAGGGGGGFGGPRDDMGGFGGPRGPRGPRSGPRY